MRITLFTSIMMVILLLSCGEKPKTLVPVMPDKRMHTYPYKFDPVWGAILIYMKSKDIDLNKQDKDTGNLITDTIPFEPKSEFGRQAIFPEVGEKFIDKAYYTMNLTLTLNPDNTTTVEVIVTVGKLSRGYTLYYKWRDQLSSGYIEKRFFAEIDSVLKTKKF